MRLPLLLIIIVFHIDAFAQLPRKGTLGIQMEMMTNSQMKILAVFENTTAYSLGLKTNDIIVSVNKNIFNDLNSFIKYVNTWKEGEDISISIIRGEQNLKKNGQVIGKSKEQSEYAKVIYGSINYDGGKLRTILELPKNVDSPPVLLYLQGVGCASYDFSNAPKNTVKLLVESIVEQGIAVFRVEKPGMGDSESPVHCLEMNYTYEVDAFKTVLDSLFTFTNINTEKIFLFGESLGTVTAPIIAKNTKVAGIIVWAGYTSTWFEYYMRLQRKQKVLLGIDYNEIYANYQRILPFYYDYLVQKTPPSQLNKKQDYKELMLKYFKDDLWSGIHHYSYFQDLNDIDVLSNYMQINCPVFALTGENDIHTSDTTWVAQLSDCINKYHPNNGSYLIVPKTTHHYFKVPSIPEYVSLLQERKLTQEYRSDNFNYDIGKNIADWIKRIKN